MTEQQTRPLADIVAEAQKRCPLAFTPTRENHDENGERDTMRFNWTLSSMGEHGRLFGHITGEWSCGSAVPLFRHPDGGGAEPLRRKVREAYTPSMATVIESLLLDYASAKQYDNGWDWADEFGYGEHNNMASIRKMVEAHPTVMRHGRFLADWFGGDLMEAAEQAACEG